MTIPWIVWGRGVEVLGPIDEPIRTMDTAATALWLLGVGIPEDWQGRPVTAPFGEPATMIDGRLADPHHTDAGSRLLR